MDQKKYIAVDLGAESGRVMLGTVADEKMALEECHRFSNGPKEQNGRLHWDFDRLMTEIIKGIGLAVKKAGGSAAGIGIDSWGVDYGLLDRKGKLLGQPYCYRDCRTDGILEKAFATMSKKEIYEASGIQIMQINSLFQLLAMKEQTPEELEKADKLVFIADLVGYYLCGQIYSEYSLASTSGLMNMERRRWSGRILEQFGLDRNLLPEIVQPGMVLGRLREELAEEMGCGGIPIIAAGSHDTACAVAGVPVQADQRWAYLSSGTWSLMGVEIHEAMINDQTFEYQFTNEGGVNNTIRLLKNIMGLWLVQECRRFWQEQGEELSYARLTELAGEAKGFQGYVDPNWGEFLSPGQMPDKICRFLKQHGQPVKEDKGQILRIVLESLAFTYRWVLEKLESILDNRIELLHMVGGGIQNELLCQLTANAIGRKVIAGPIEATASGNVLIQAIGTGQVASLRKAREIIANSYRLKEYSPQGGTQWNQEYKRFLACQN